MSEKRLVTLKLRAGTLTAEVPPEETEDVLTGARSVVREILDRLRQGRHRPAVELGLR